MERVSHPKIVRLELCGTNFASGNLCFERA